MVERSQKEVWRLTPWLMLVLLLGNFILMAVDARQADSKQRMIRVWMQAAADVIQSPVTTISTAVSDYFSKISSLRDASSENDQLKQRVQELELQVQQKQTLTSENERLKSLLNLQEEKGATVLPARIIGRDPSSWFNYAIINRGSYAGVELNMPVITNDGLVGRIVAVSPLTSQFMLLSDERSGVSGIVGQTGTSNILGIVRGMKNSDQLEITYVPGSVEVQVGETVYTTGLDGVFPPDIKIGQVVDVRKSSVSTSQTVYVQPSARISSLREVAVLLHKNPGKPQWDKYLPNVVKDGDVAKTDANTASATTANRANTNQAAPVSNTNANIRP